MRKAAFLGKLYESEYRKLDKQIKKCFEHGPGSLPVNNRDKNLRAAIIPSCNYDVSGNAAAWAYKEIAESKYPEVYIILSGTDTGSKAYLSLEDFETPFGSLINSKIYTMNKHVVIDESVHRIEKGIEIQLPFLQYISRDKFENVKIMPVLIGNCDFESLRSIANAIKSISRRYVVIASCNLSYCGERFGKTPFKYNVEDEISIIDVKAVELIRNGDVEGFWKLADKFNMKDRRIIFVLLEILRGRSGKLLMYDDSKEITGKDNFITYCSMIF